MSNKQFKEMALQTLEGKWGLAAKGALIYVVFVAIFEGLTNFHSSLSLINIILAGSLSLGFTLFFLSFSREEDAEVGQVLQGFNYFTTAMFTYLLMALFVLLWTICLIIPGIIAAISYSMTFFILADNPHMKPMEAIDKSKEMMEGHKLQYFYLLLSFIGWFLLCILTLGIGFIWLLPYIQISASKFYDHLKENEMAEEIVENAVIG